MPPPVLDKVMRQAARHHAAGRVREAAAIYQQVLQKDPHHAAALHGLGVMAFQTGRPTAAEKLLVRALAADPLRVSAHDDLASLRLSLGRADEALAGYRHAIRLEPTYPLAHAHLGAALARLGQFEQAVSAYQRAVELGVLARRRRVAGIAVAPPFAAAAGRGDVPVLPPIDVAVPVRAADLAGLAEGAAPGIGRPAEPVVAWSAIAVDLGDPSRHTTAGDVEVEGKRELNGSELGVPQVADPAVTDSAVGGLADDGTPVANPTFAEPTQVDPIFAEPGVHEAITDPATDGEPVAADPPYPVHDTDRASGAWTVESDAGELASDRESQPVARPLVADVAAAGEAYVPAVAGAAAWDVPAEAGALLEPVADRVEARSNGSGGRHGWTAVGALSASAAADVVPPEVSPGDAQPPVVEAELGDPQADAPWAAALALPSPPSSVDGTAADTTAGVVEAGLTTSSSSGRFAESDAGSAFGEGSGMEIGGSAFVGGTLEVRNDDGEDAIATTTARMTTVEPPTGGPGSAAAAGDGGAFGIAMFAGGAANGALLLAGRPALPPIRPPNGGVGAPGGHVGRPAVAVARPAAGAMHRVAPSAGRVAVGSARGGDGVPRSSGEPVSSAAAFEGGGADGDIAADFVGSRRFAGPSDTDEPAAPGGLAPIPMSALEIPDADADPMVASRSLAKQLRKVRRTPAAAAQQALELHKEGTQFLRQRRVEEAIGVLRQLVELHPASARAHRDLGAAYLRADRLDDAQAALVRALELRPRFADAFASIGDVFHLQGKVDEAIACYRKALQLKPSAAKVHSNLLLTLNYHRKLDAKVIFAEHAKWADQHARALAAEIREHHNDPDPDRPIRVGYVSPDFRRHSVNYFVEPLLTARDRGAFHVTCYSDVIRPDDETDRIMTLCDRWRDARPLSDEELAKLVRDDEIDILVDLAGHTGTNRLGVFARKPAPVQVTYLGYPNTTGLGAIDYRLTDAAADPPGKTEPFHIETLVRLPHFLCYQPPADAPPVGPSPIAKNGFVTFGCFNVLAKVNPEAMGLWAKMMAVLPGSRLVMKDRLGTLAYPARRRYVQDIFAYHRVAADRLDLLGKEPDFGNHLSAYGKVDVMLDPFPYNGTTTTCEALWMGVPVVALAGTRHAARVGVSVLQAAELPELVAATPEAYARTAVALARDPQRLGQLRAGMRQRMSASPLLDAAAFTASLENAYRDMWQHWCRAPHDGGGMVDTLSLSDE